ncbi:HAD-IIB family hydrolase [Mycoplasma procyoni]|uniref:HAD-IIB family hydrolase n=1 Tax=Mycoplasma procyoni TaxID=568784 RepID=UPI00197C01AA|nr:HAD family hydrolase [Mycoplasma procyoni]MBN3534789.1 HAD family phosphatase [Mycoplasma procyoni]
MIKKLIAFSDADGTIYGRDFRASEELKQDIKRFQKEGGEFVVSTGNPAFERHQNLADELGIRYLITSNGSSVFDNKTKTYLLNNVFPEKMQEIIILMSNKYGSQLNYWDDQNYYTWNAREEFSYSYDFSLLDTSVIIESNKVYKNVVKMELFDTVENIKEIYDQIKDLDLNIAFMRPQHLEITMKQSSKGLTAKWFAKEFFDEDIKNCMTIGDSANDWPMFELSDYSYAMENANDLTRSKTHFKTSRFDQNGVGLALRDYVDRTKNLMQNKKS